MGLDMYLRKRTYVKNWDHMGPEARHTVTITGPRAAHIRPERITYIEEEVAYWRKANAIHQWFVDVCQDGVDECQETYVTRQNLETLRDLCAELITLHETDPAAAHERAVEDLSPQSGCFFGSTDIDEYYWEDVRETATMLTTLLNETAPEDDEGYVYQSSW